LSWANAGNTLLLPALADYNVALDSGILIQVFPSSLAASGDVLQEGQIASGKTIPIETPTSLVKVRPV